MSMLGSEVSCFFKNLEGGTTSISIRIVLIKVSMSINSTPALQLFSDNIAYENGEEPLQLLEDCRYEFELNGLPHGMHLLENQIISINQIDYPALRGHINTKQQTGILAFEVIDSAGKICFKLFAEIQSSKLNYRQDYRAMLEYLATKNLDLLLSLSATTKLNLAPTASNDVSTNLQRFMFLQTIMGSGKIIQAIEQITSFPHAYLSEELQNSDIRKIGKGGSALAKQLGRFGSRIGIPEAHSAHQLMKTQGVASPSLPSRLIVKAKIETIDTAENQFVKFVLTTLANYMNQMVVSLQKSNLPSKVMNEADKLNMQLNEIVENDFFQDISQATFLPLGSPVLQRKGGYREIYQIWIKFNLAAVLIWKGGEDIFRGGKRDLDILYEYWVYFQLLDLITTKFNISQPFTESLITYSYGEFTLNLKGGIYSSIERTTVIHNRELAIRMSYNRQFMRNTSYGNVGSWTRTMRPDITLSVWPSQFSNEEAERQELIAHLHFDAKYKLDLDISEEMAGNEEEIMGNEISSENGENRSYKAEDLLKMHTYRDAIRNTEGAFIVFPGNLNSNQIWRYRDILPGIGAFPMTPDREGNVQFTDILSKYLDDVILHLCNRATRRDDARYYNYLALSRGIEPDLFPINVPLPEKQLNGKRETLLSEQFVLAIFRPIDMVEWFKNKNQVWLLLSNSKDYFIIDPKLSKVTYIITIDDNEMSYVWKVKKENLRVEIIENHPHVNLNGINAIFNIEQENVLTEWRWNSASFAEFQQAPYKALALAPLDEILRKGMPGVV